MSLRRWISPSLIAALVVASGGPGYPATPPRQATDEEPVTLLAPFKVEDFSANLGFTWNAWFNDDEKIRLIKFTRIAPRSIASKAGLKVGDRLTAIDGNPVIGCDLTELGRLFLKDLTPGQTVTWLFSIERGLFARETRAVRFKVKIKPTDAPLDAEADAASR